MAAPVPPVPRKEEGNATIGELRASLITLATIPTGDEQVQSRWPDQAHPTEWSIL